MGVRTKFDRRQFLIGASAATVTLGLGRLAVGLPDAHARSDVLQEVTRRAYHGWQDVYRQRWTWDSIHKGTHYVNCWYQRGCNWNVFVKDGVVFREEQAALYEQTNADVPDFNPRGCQKGACYSERMYDAGRLRHPLERVGARGEGRWRRISWDEAFTKIADRMIDVLRTSGPGAIVWDMGTGSTNGCHGIGMHRMAMLLDTPVLDMNAEIGDHHPGATVTAGKICFASSADDMFYSDLILVWGGNPVYTQIPNAHFLNEARYRGATVVSITPDYNPSSIHADLWIPVNVGTDAALGLAMARVMIEEGLHDEAFLREQTDFPLLVRKDTDRFLRAEDRKASGADDVFFVYDRRTQSVVEAPRNTLALGDVDPALEGEFRVDTKDGEILVEPVFARFRRSLDEYAPEAVSRITGTPPDLIRDLARRIGRARAATCLTQSNFSKFYHGLEMERVQILVLVLAGHVGKKGSGIAGFPYLSLAGFEALSVASGSLPPKLALLALGARMAPSMIKAKLAGYTDEMFLYEAARDEYKRGGFLPSSIYLHMEGGLDRNMGRSREWDPHLQRDIGEFLEEAIERGWQVGPKTSPRILFEVGGNLLRRIRGYDKLYDGLLPKLDLLVTADWRMSNTALHSDIVLPAAGFYEKDDITWATPISPFAHVTTAAVKPIADSKTDWEIHGMLTKRLQDRAKEGGATTFRDRAGEERRLDDVYDQYSYQGRFRPDNVEEVLQEILEITTNLGGIGWNDLKERGFARYTSLGMSVTNIGNATDITPNETITANTWHTEKKIPWPTLTRRLQFYVDHPFFLELGEELPVHKDNPPIGGDYPLQMTGGHARWSIHSMWRDEPNLLRLQRGEPAVMMSETDLRSRGLEDGQRVRVRNDVGEFEARAKLSMSLRPGQVVVYHAWEPYQFKGHRSHQVLTPSPINPVQLAGGQFHLQPLMITGEPGMNDRGTRVEVEAAR